MTTVRIPRPEEERAPLGTALGAALIGASLGLAIAWWGQEPAPVGDERPVFEAEAGAGAEAESETETESETESETATEAETEAVAGTEAETEGEADAVAETDAEAAVTTTGSQGVGAPSGLTLAPGRVAYLRCEGVPQRDGPFPCPRDESLEAATWAALHALERCPTLGSAGAADVVLDFEGDAPPTIRVRDTFPADTIRLDAEGLLACAAGPLAEVRTILRPRRLVVSFRLSLAAGSR